MGLWTISRVWASGSHSGEPAITYNDEDAGSCPVTPTSVGRPGLTEPR
jgi:hypothetical protein